MKATRCPYYSVEFFRFTFRLRASMPRRYFAPGGSNVVFRPIYGDVSSEKFSLKQLFTVATICSNTCFFCFSLPDTF